jgi:quinoprotein glucose dehydrogenase
MASHTASPSTALLRFAALAAAAWAGVAHPQAASGPSVWDGVYTEGQARRGSAIYARECAECHGPTLKESDGAPPLAAPDFLATWNGFSAADLYERIRKTMPVSAPGKLSAQQYADVLARILEANAFPAGPTELDGRPDALRRIRIDAARPKK